MSEVFFGCAAKGPRLGHKRLWKQSFYVIIDTPDIFFLCLCFFFLSVKKYVRISDETTGKRGEKKLVEIISVTNGLAKIHFLFLRNFYARNFLTNLSLADNFLYIFCYLFTKHYKNYNIEYSFNSKIYVGAKNTFHISNVVSLLVLVYMWARESCV